MSDYLENALLNLTVNATAYTPPSNVYLALLLSNPTDTGIVFEVTGINYSRHLVTFTTATTGTVSNNSIINFAPAGSLWGDIGWVGIYDALTGGNLLYHTPLDTVLTIDVGNIFKISVGNLTITLD